MDISRYSDIRANKFTSKKLEYKLKGVCGRKVLSLFLNKLLLIIHLDFLENTIGKKVLLSDMYSETKELLKDKYEYE